MKKWYGQYVGISQRDVALRQPIDIEDNICEIPYIGGGAIMLKQF